MAYIDAFLEPQASYGWQGGPTFSTRIVQMRNNRERRNADWAEARHSYSYSFENIERDEYRSIKRHHLVCRGMLHCFPFIDALDFEAESEAFAQGDGVTKVFQLRKISTLDGISYTRNCYVILKAAVTSDGAPVAPTVDMRRGTVTFSVAPASGKILRWTGEHGVWVRFNQDDLPFSIPAFEMATGSVDLIEVPPPGAGE